MNKVKLVLLLILLTSINNTVAQDPEQVGVKEGDEFIYNVSALEGNITRDLNTFFGEDFLANHISPGLVFNIKIMQFSENLVNFNYSTSESWENITTEMDNFGEIILYNDWTYWRNQMDSGYSYLGKYGVPIQDDIIVVETEETWGIQDYANHSFTANEQRYFPYSELHFNLDLDYNKIYGVLNHIRLNITLVDLSGTEELNLIEVGLTQILPKVEDTIESSDDNLLNFNPLFFISLLVIIPIRKMLNKSKY
ncbi:MAG: hypothetical protein OEZ01_11530 [Candidatus Heimdallarchaeota archaeon]|nr:hypothetical protein [Candidatus Heimdallarchaeota archaeon]MDH5646633.1 hypothetical protein [Candidatus Heimdallarchaeota archaeon]